MRDFTYIDDIANGTVKVLDRFQQGNLSFDHMNPTTSHTYRLYNIGNYTPGAADGLHRHY